MKFRVTMKDPDVLTDAIAEAVDSQVHIEGVDEEEMMDIRRSRVEKIYEMCSRRWFEYGEYLVVEIDTDAKTCVVVPN